VGTLKPRKHEQRLLRNMGVHKVVLDLLQIPFDTKEDVRMNELMQLAHRFLQNFCLGNQSNQVGSHLSALDGALIVFKWTVSRDFLLQVFFMNLLPPIP
jgi:hypothetical protein